MTTTRSTTWRLKPVDLEIAHAFCDHLSHARRSSLEPLRARPLHVDHLRPLLRRVLSLRLSAKSAAELAESYPCRGHPKSTTMDGVEFVKVNLVRGTMLLTEARRLRSAGMYERAVKDGVRRAATAERFDASARVEWATFDEDVFNARNAATEAAVEWQRHPSVSPAVQRAFSGASFSPAHVKNQFKLLFGIALDPITLGALIQDVAGDKAARSVNGMELLNYLRHRGRDEIQRVAAERVREQYEGDSDGGEEEAADAYDYGLPAHNTYDLETAMEKLTTGAVHYTRRNAGLAGLGPLRGDLDGKMMSVPELRRRLKSVLAVDLSPSEAAAVVYDTSYRDERDGAPVGGRAPETVARSDVIVNRFFRLKARTRGETGPRDVNSGGGWTASVRSRNTDPDNAAMSPKLARIFRRSKGGGAAAAAAGGTADRSSSARSVRRLAGGYAAGWDEFYE